MRVTPLAALLVAADQVTKYLAVTRLTTMDAHTFAVVPGFFNLSYVENRGAAWGMLAGQQRFLIAFSLLTLVFLAWKRRELFLGLRAGPAALALISGGVIGNLIDRVRLGHVIDFLDFHWRDAYHFPAFNIADSCICCGVFLYLLTQWLHDRNQAKSTTDAPTFSPPPSNP